MSSVWADAIGHIFTFLAALLAAIVSYYARKQSEQNSNKLTDIHVFFNGRVDELIQLTKETAYAAGVQFGRNHEVAKPKAGNDKAPGTGN